MSAQLSTIRVFSGALRWGIRASGQFNTDVVIHSEPGRPSLHQDHSVRFALPTSEVSTASEPRAGHGARDAWIASHRPEDPRSRARGMQLSRVSPSWSCLTYARRTGPRPAALGSRRRVLRAVPGVRRHREDLAVVVDDQNAGVVGSALGRGSAPGRCRSAALGQNRPHRSDAIGLGRHHRGPIPGCERARPHVLGGLRARRGDRCRCSVFFPARPRNRICWLARNPGPLRLSCTKASLLGLRRWPTAGSSLRGMAQTRMSPGSPRLTAAIIYQSLDAPL
jgi:hypothetical protein